MKNIDIVDLKRLVQEGKLSFYIKDDYVFVRNNQTEEVVCLSKK